MTRRLGLQQRLLLAFSIPLVFALLVSVASVLYVVDRLLIHQVQRRVGADLRAAREIYDARLERLREVVRLGASLPSVQRALASGDAEGLRAQLQALRVRHGEDFLTAVDGRGVVVLRARNPAAAGDAVSHLVPVRRALVGEETAGTEELSAEDLGREGEDLARRARIPLVPAGAGPAAELRSALTLVAAAPVLDGGGRVVGALYVGEILNRSQSLVDRIRSTVFSDATDADRPLGTATVFLRDVRVATNVPGGGGERALGTRASAAVADRVLRQRATWVDRAFVVNDWYLSAYEPIADAGGEVIGMLYVGILERPYRALLWRTLGVVGGIQVAGGLLLLALGATLARALAQPVRRLAEGARRIEAGDLSHEIAVTSDDEIGDLAREFNAMTASLRQRDAAIDGLTKGLEEKVRERSRELESRNEDLVRARGELLDLMEKQRRTNEELQASLERLQTTQEGLIRSGKLAALGALAAGVAHEINNPLAVIQGNVEILRLKGEEEGREEVELIADQVVRVQKIVASLLTFARKEERSIETLDLNALVEETLELAAPQARQGGVVVETSLAPGLPALTGDAGRLTQVFTNLVVNALQATPRGGRLAVSTGASEDGAYLYASFADTGPGVAPQDRDKIWNPFYTTKPSGTGLGLSISHALVEEHGGRITLESEPGKGSTFTVILPRAA